MCVGIHIYIYIYIYIYMLNDRYSLLTSHACTHNTHTVLGQSGMNKTAPPWNNYKHNYNCLYHICHKSHLSLHITALHNKYGIYVKKKHFYTIGKNIQMPQMKYGLHHCCDSLERTKEAVQNLTYLLSTSNKFPMLARNSHRVMSFQK